MRKYKFFVGVNHDRRVEVLTEARYEWEQTVGDPSRFVSLTEVEADRASQAIWEAGRQEGRKEAIAEFREVQDSE